jgi:aspartate aminotransferase
MTQISKLRFNKRLMKVLPSPTLAITAKAKQLKAEGKDVVNFAGGEPDFDTPETIKEKAIQAINDGFTKYTPSIGSQELRQAVVRKFKDDNHINYDLSQIVISCGAKHSIFNTVMALVDDLDEVIIPSPYWVSYPEMVKIAGGQPVFIETNAAQNFKITPDQLESAITEKSRLLIFSSPSNPTGMVYTHDELMNIADICVRNDLFVISDEIYEKLLYQDHYTSIASLNSKIFERTITVNGVSKAYSMTGWRIGYSGAPKEVQQYVKKIQDHSTSNPTSISQMAALQALNEPPNVVRCMCSKFRQRRDLMASLLDKIPQVKYILPQGSFYMFCDFSELGNSYNVADSILEEVNVAMVPGEGFGASGHMRMSFSTSEERIEEGIQRIASWIKSHA